MNGLVHLYLHDYILVKYLYTHQKKCLQTDKTVPNFTLANTFVLVELLTDGVSARMMLMLYVLQVVNKIVHSQTVKLKDEHFRKLV